MEAVPRMPMIWLDLKEAGEFQFSPSVKQVRDHTGLIESHTTVIALIHSENKQNSLFYIGDLLQIKVLALGLVFQLLRELLCFLKETVQPKIPLTKISLPLFTYSDVIPNPSLSKSLCLLQTHNSICFIKFSYLYFPYNESGWGLVLSNTKMTRRHHRNGQLLCFIPNVLEPYYSFL